MKMTPKTFPFLLVGTMADGTEWRDSRTSVEFLEDALKNWFDNPMLEQSVGHATVYLWADDLHKSEWQNALLKKHGFVFFADISPIADRHNAKLQAFVDGYTKLIRETGFFVGVDCHAVEPMVCQAHNPKAMAEALGLINNA